MKKLLLCSLLLLVNILIAQEEDKNEEGWKTTGKLTFLMNQSAFSNWLPGGENAFTGNVNLNYDFNYSKNGWVFDNKIIAFVGVSAIQGEDPKKTDDRLELNSILAKNFDKQWSFSFFGNIKTQFLDGYDFTESFEGDNTQYPTSGFFKPVFISFGPGLFWKKSDDFSFNFAPVTSKFNIITSEIFTYNGTEFVSSNDIETFGVTPGKTGRYEFGMNFRGYYRVNLMENISMENILTLFADYKDRPQNVDTDYTMNLVMKINDVFSTNLTFQAVYDDNALQALQVKQTFGVGISYVF
ncbi:MAG: DUF3078 domain-containing protein [Flavicella sp.]